MLAGTRATVDGKLELLLWGVTAILAVRCSVALLPIVGDLRGSLALGSSLPRTFFYFQGASGPCSSGWLAEDQRQAGARRPTGC
jgi:hypothetical protein